MTEPAIETRTLDIKGRQITVKQLKDVQLILMGRDAETLGREGVDAGRKLRAAGFIMDMFESAIVSQDDRDYVLQLTRSGELELTDFLGLLSVFHQDGAVAVKPAVRRGRPRKTAK